MRLARMWWMLLAAGSPMLAQTRGPDTDVTIPEHARVAFTSLGRGVQIYACQPQGVAYEWAFVAPEATLYSAAGEQQGTHGAGPRWTWADGSSIAGKVVQKKQPENPLDIPWLLVAVTSAPGRAGALQHIAFVRRSETHGGLAPAGGCDEAHSGVSVRVPYTAAYTFYLPG